jgi:hypothetical protein
MIGFTPNWGNRPVDYSLHYRTIKVMKMDEQLLSPIFLKEKEILQDITILRDGT